MYRYMIYFLFNHNGQLLKISFNDFYILYRHILKKKIDDNYPELFNISDDIKYHMEAKVFMLIIFLTILVFKRKCACKNKKVLNN